MASIRKTHVTNGSGYYAKWSVCMLAYGSIVRQPPMITKAQAIRRLHRAPSGICQRCLAGLNQTIVTR